MLEGVALRYFNVFGPRQDPHSAYAAVVPAFMKAALAGGSAPVFGGGQQTRDFTYVDNVVDANLLAAGHEAERVSGMVFNVGGGERTSVLDLLHLVREVTGLDVRRADHPPRAGDVAHSLASLDRARQMLGYDPGVRLRQGLALTWEWVRSDLAGFEDHSSVR
jgi:nucleoside-diphosphate-sugar epimerase